MPASPPPNEEHCSSVADISHCALHSRPTLALIIRAHQRQVLHAPQQETDIGISTLCDAVEPLPATRSCAVIYDPPTVHNSEFNMGVAKKDEDYEDVEWM